MASSVKPVRESVSPDGKYRYRLGIKLSHKASACLFLMLNPSTREERTRRRIHPPASKSR